ncbi:alkylphosphonate utilization protein [Flavihumibacter sp. CACIAM 22H1]|uniref:PhnA domain-containing protein n=1 Tax=Flavihumibacter sp. CACIAM 22H1 TaxID=1812911 RepID=UPI0007A82F71|nr:alkylphosphonate utilization protein [Flavihumibacter sp. CACIAM 22H1]KYP13380.1 MAG: PhnA protein [Flavihumibacter sp. CACIAM 22H1]
MLSEKALQSRSGNACELCLSVNGLTSYEVGPDTATKEETAIYVCSKCKAQLEKKELPDLAHWKCLEQSMWSEIPAIQVVSWRMLNRLRADSWAADLLDMFYLPEEAEAWAKASGDHVNDGSVELHRDTNGALLQDGDTVVLTKSLDVKGSTLTARLGTVVKNIRLVKDNVEQIEGRVEGQQIVILTKFIRKQA